MKKVVLFVLVALLATPAMAAPGWDNRDYVINGSAGLRAFSSSDTCGVIVDGWWKGGVHAYNSNSYCNDNDACTIDRNRGRNPGYTDTCCENINALCKADGTLKSKEEIAEIESAIAAQDAAEEFRSIMDPRASHWGYYQSTNRSSNNGRSVSLDARLDACLTYSNVDNISDYRSCETACNDGNKNTHCTANSSEVCIDRCQCKYPGNGTCNNL